MKESNPPPENAVRPGIHYTGRGTWVDEGAIRNPQNWSWLLYQAVVRTEITRAAESERLGVEPALSEMRRLFVRAHQAGGKVVFIGNGGSAAIASHMAVDYSKNAGIRAVALNDAAMVTCLANDFGFEHVFAKQMEFHATRDDVAVIISSSGRSENIQKAADAARTIPCAALVTFSGMDPNNRLRAKGELNFWVPARDYGLIEIAHLMLLHPKVIREAQ